jgi:hypothetical protein
MFTSATANVFSCRISDLTSHVMDCTKMLKWPHATPGPQVADPCCITLDKWFISCHHPVYKTILKHNSFATNDSDVSMSRNKILNQEVTRLRNTQKTDKWLNNRCYVTAFREYTFNYTKPVRIFRDKVRLFTSLAEILLDLSERVLRK